MNQSAANQARSGDNEKNSIAIVGIGCRFPGGATDPGRFWDLLCQETDAITEVPEGRWNKKQFYDPDPGPGKTYTRWGGFLDDVQGFDASFFGISPREATAIDPQQRLLLEVAWEALEDAGQMPARLVGSKTGVFVGLWSGDYEDFMFSDPGHIDFYRTQGTGRYTAAGRISFILGLEGPAMALDTACSSSLVTVHLAANAIANGECSLAIAGGANLLLQPQITIAYSQSKMMSPEGRCKFGDASGAGYVRSEGVGLVVLKSLDRALADGDRIHAIVRGSAVNNDGRSSGSFGTPGISGQEAMLRDAYSRAGVEGRDVVYVEAHGTGTKKGDPVEVQAIGRVLGGGHSIDNPLYIGSVKTNIGHMEAAAGIGGLIKSVLTLENRAIPPSLHFKEPNPRIPWNSLPIKVPTENITIENDGAKSVFAGVNSFGISGTNAHIVLESPPTGKAPATLTPATEEGNRLEMLTLSARGEESLRQMAGSFAELLRSEGGPSLRDVCFTANTRRSRLEDRVALWGSSREEMAAALDAFVADELPADGGEGSVELTGNRQRKKLVFVFSGQGSQWPGMTTKLAENNVFFKKSMDELETLVQKHAGWSLAEELARPEGQSKLDGIDIMWPAIFAVQVSLTRMLEAYGVRPDAVVGHSIGEAAAAFASGALSLEDATRVIVHQGRLVHSTSGDGGMALVGVPFSDAIALVAGNADVVAAIAASPGSTVFSGERGAVEKIQKEQEAAGVFARMVKTDAAVHSPRMDKIEDELLAALADVAPRESKVTFYSTVTGSELPGDSLDADYWWRNIRQPVQFADACEGLLENHGAFLEVSPHPIVSVSVSECAEAAGREVVSANTLRRQEDEAERMRQALDLLDAEAGITSVEPAEGGAPVPEFVDHPDRPATAFVFSGQGQQWWAMGRELLESDRTFRAKIEEIDKLLSEHADWSLIEELNRGENDTRLNETEIAQPAIFALQVALAALWQERGIMPDAVIGHSVGEVAAAHVSGALELKEAVRVIFHRGRLMQAATGLGKMAALEIPLEEAREALKGYEDKVAVGASNAPTSTVLSGETKALEEILNKLQGKGISHKMLPVNYAFHSPQMEPFKDELVETLSGLKVGDAKTAIVSTVTGRFAYGDDFDATYWGSNVRQGVLFAVGMDALVKAGISLFVEISAHPVLSGYIGQSLEHRGREGFAVPSLRRKMPADVMMRAALAKLFVLGRVPDWSTVYSGGERVVQLPVYAWQHEPYWVEIDRDEAELAYQLSELDHPYLGRRLETALPIFEAQLNHQSPLVEKYEIFETTIIPPAVMLESVLAAGREVMGPAVWELNDVSFQDLAAIGAQDARKTQIMLRGDGEGAPFAFEFSAQVSRGSNLWQNHARGELDTFAGDPPAFAAPDKLTETLDSEKFKALCQDQHIEIGTLFDWVQTVNRGRSGARLELSAPEFDEGETFAYHPAVMELGLQLAGIVYAGQADLSSGYVAYPQKLERFVMTGRPGAGGVVEVTLAEDDGSATVVWRNEQGDVVAFIEGLVFRPIGRDAGFRALHPRMEEWVYDRTFLPVALGEADVPSLPARGSWLVFADEKGCGGKVAARLVEQGLKAAVVRAGKSYEARDEFLQIDPRDPEQYQKLLREVAGRKIDGILHCWSIDAEGVDRIDHAGLARGTELGSLSLLHLVKALEKEKQSPELWIATRGAESVHGRGHGLAVAQAPTRALGDVIALEYPDLNARRVDLDGQAPADEIDPLFRELCAADVEDQIVYRDRIRYVCRLLRVSEDDGANAGDIAGGGDGANRRLVINEPGILDKLEFRKDQRRAPSAGEIEIDVRATGLNFRDVLTAMNVYEGRPGPLGLECAGVVTQVGPGVEDFKVGDEVLGICPSGGFAGFVTESEDLFVQKPAAMSLDQAATIPITFLTSYLCLQRLARISSRDRVLIHSGAGGVGLAAIQIARQAGAEVFVTVSTPEKRRLMESLGVRHVFNSRSTDYADEIKKITGGAGIDIILNSLSSEFIRKNFEILAPDGRYLEIGKKDILTAREVREIQPRASYFIIDLMETVAEEPDLIKFMLLSLVDELNAGNLQALPFTGFDLNDAAEAFRHMTRGKHTGKIIVNQSAGSGGARAARPSSRKLKLRKDSSYLVTGGMGSLGMGMARWLIDRGAGHVSLTGRRGLPDRKAWDSVSDADTKSKIAAIRALEAGGARVTVYSADVKDEDRMREVIALINEQAPLRGIVHAAGLLNPALIRDLDRAAFEAVLEPKIAGTWNLHKLTGDLPLDFTLYFSSGASVWGSAELGHYAAANRFLDAMAHLRNATGKRTLSLNFGPFADGMAAGDVQEGWARIGLYPLLTENATHVIERLLPTNEAQRTVAFVDWKRFKATLEARAKRPLLETFEEAVEAGGESSAEAGGESFLDGLQPLSPEQREDAFFEFVQGAVRQVLGLKGSKKIDSKTGFFQMGLDSLMTVELRNRIAVGVDEYGGSLPKNLAFDYPNVEALAGFLVETTADYFEGSDGVAPAGDSAAAPAAAPAGVATAPASTSAPAATGSNGDAPATAAWDEGRAKEEINALSDEEAEAELIKELQSLGMYKED